MENWEKQCFYLHSLKLVISAASTCHAAFTGLRKALKISQNLKISQYLGSPQIYLKFLWRQLGRYYRGWAGSWLPNNGGALLWGPGVLGRDVPPLWCRPGADCSRETEG